MEGDLRRAVDCEEFTVEFQPIVRLDSGGLTGFEALVRWQHPSGRRVSPAEFIPIAEDTGLIVQMGRWVIQRACRRIRRLQEEDQPKLSMTVNVSGRQLQQPDFPDDVARAILVEGIDPGCLVLEITETVMMQDTEATLARLSELKALGVRLAIDDFGTGYSSLNYLHKFPVDILKIDRSFVQRISETGDGAVARAIIGLSKALRLSTVAEGIEEAEQAAALAALGCELGQGYYFAKPIAEDELSVAVRALQCEPVTQHGLDAARWPRLVRKGGKSEANAVPRSATA
jgi:EAL domain-containing protein (putative c-di-GMP-specific phosphodiesterase class I)